MIITPSERRRAEEFDALLSGRRNERSPEHGVNALATLTSRLQAIDTGADVDPMFRDRLRTRLIAVATVRGIGSEPQFRPSPGRPAVHARPRRRASKRLVIAAGTVTGVLALSGVSMASGDANPGDALYSIKRSREAAQLALARSDVGRGQLHLEFAKTRLVEAVAVADQPGEVGRILDEMDADMRTGMRDLGGAALEQRATPPLDLVDTFAIAERQGLLSLLSGVPQGRTRDRVLESVQLLGDIGNRSAALRGTLLCSGSLTGSNASDELGPLPRGCSALGTLRPGGTPVPGQPSNRSGSASPSGPGLPRTSSPSPSPSASDVLDGLPLTQSPTTDRSGANGVLGTVTDVVGGVVGGLLGRLTP